MSFLTQGITGATKIVTRQPTSNSSVAGTEPEEFYNAGGLIPAIERAILKLGNNTHSPVDENNVVIQQPTAPELDAPPPYSILYPDNETNTTFDSNIARSFQNNAWQEIVINGHELFKNLSESDNKLLEEAVNTPDSSIYAVKIALDVAEDQKCSSFNEFLRIFTLVKNYLKFKSEKQMKSVVPKDEIRQTTRYDPGLTSQVDPAPVQTRQQNMFGDPYCCWFYPYPSYHDPCPGCFCCCNCCDHHHDTTDAVPSTDHCCGDNCCEDCGDCDCGDCDCGDCDCGGCDCDCGGCDCGF